MVHTVPTHSSCKLQRGPSNNSCQKSRGFRTTVLQLYRWSASLVRHREEHAWHSAAGVKVDAPMLLRVGERAACCCICPRWRQVPCIKVHTQPHMCIKVYNTPIYNFICTRSDGMATRVNASVLVKGVTHACSTTYQQGVAHKRKSPRVYTSTGTTIAK